jgi:hypothetical protein
MRKLFRCFERLRVEYLLISGQATVLYGAATFSEDVDLWIRPTARNASATLQALATIRARVHRLTPPMNVRNMKAGHGFHFIVPERPLDGYLDIMACPPRVSSFAAALRRARSLPTDWGVLPVVHPVDLVELKKTRRLADYDVITNLALLHLAEGPPTAARLRWAAQNAFRAEERADLLTRLGERTTIQRCARQIASQLTKLQARDRKYWSKVIDELREMRRARTLWPDGALVSAKLRS